MYMLFLFLSVVSAKLSLTVERGSDTHSVYLQCGTPTCGYEVHGVEITIGHCVDTNITMSSSIRDWGIKHAHRDGHRCIIGRGTAACDGGTPLNITTDNRRHLLLNYTNSSSIPDIVDNHMDTNVIIKRGDGFEFADLIINTTLDDDVNKLTSAQSWMSNYSYDIIKAPMDRMMDPDEILLERDDLMRLTYCFSDIHPRLTNTSENWRYVKQYCYDDNDVSLCDIMGLARAAPQKNWPAPVNEYYKCDATNLKMAGFSGTLLTRSEILRLTFCYSTLKFDVAYAREYCKIGDDFNCVTIGEKCNMGVKSYDNVTKCDIRTDADCMLRYSGYCADTEETCWRQADCHNAQCVHAESIDEKRTTACAKWKCSTQI